jgi:hypothetical protein
MKRLAIGIALAAILATPSAVLGFHHVGLPSTACHAPVMLGDGTTNDPGNNNGQAKENLSAHNPFGLPLPPLGSPGNSGLDPVPGRGQGEGGEHCANG